MQELLLALARENLELRYEDGADVPATLARLGDGSVELRVGGKPWRAWALSRHGRSLPANAGGLDTHRDSITIRCAGGKPWRAWLRTTTADSSEPAGPCLRMSMSPASASVSPAEGGDGKSAVPLPYGWEARREEYESMTPYQRMKASSGRGRRGEEALREARRLEEVATQVRGRLRL
jgi:hypothetical protein